MVLRPCVQIERGWMSRVRAVDSMRRRCFFCDEIAECRGIGAFFSSFFSSCTALEARLVYKVVWAFGRKRQGHRTPRVTQIYFNAATMAALKFA